MQPWYCTPQRRSEVCKIRKTCTPRICPPLHIRIASTRAGHAPCITATTAVSKFAHRVTDSAESILLCLVCFSHRRRYRLLQAFKRQFTRCTVFVEAGGIRQDERRAGRQRLLRSPPSLEHDGVKNVSHCKGQYAVFLDWRRRARGCER